MATSCNRKDANYLQVFYDCSNIARGPVAFMVRNVGKSSLSSTVVVPWESVITNFGGHYNPLTYTFVCPYNGVYVFSTSIYTYDDHIAIGVYRNNFNLFRVDANTDRSDLDSSSGSVVAECFAGDVVWAEVYKGGPFHMEDENVQLFSGFLLNKL